MEGKRMKRRGKGRKKKRKTRGREAHWLFGISISLGLFNLFLTVILRLCIFGHVAKMM